MKKNSKRGLLLQKKISISELLMKHMVFPRMEEKEKRNLNGVHFMGSFSLGLL